jgi:hypothetical protein
MPRQVEEGQMRRPIVLAAVVLTAGCTTTLRVHRVTSAASSRVGVPYPLMFTRYGIELTRQVAGCGPELKAAVKAEIKATEGAPDPRQWFVLDPNSLASALKTSEVKVQYHPNGGVASLNATAEDRTGQVVANLTATAAKLVSILAAAGAAPGVTAEACSPEVLAALDTVKKQRPVVAAATQVVDSLTAELKALFAKALAAGGNVDEATKAAISRTYDLLAAATQDLEEKSLPLEKALKVITFVETVYWPPDGDTTNGEYALPEAVFKRWGAVDEDPGERGKFTVSLSLTKIGGEGRDPSKPDVVEPGLGIPYRQPVLGRLAACTGTPCGDDNVPIARKDGDVLQFGHVYYLPCRSRAFSSVNCAFETLESGRIKTMGTAQKAATAEGLTAAVKDAVTQAGAAQDTLRNAETARLEARTKALKAEADYRAAVAALQPKQPDPLQKYKEDAAALKAEADLFNAQRALLEAQAALNEALAKAGRTSF